MALNDKLTQINKLKRDLDALQPMSRENETNFWKKVRLDWNFNSNHIEGNTLTYGETMLLLIFDKTTGDHELREYEEMKAHDVAIHMVKEWAQDKSRDLTESDIRELNKVILIKPYWKEAITQDGQQTRRQIKVGDYKEHPNSVRLKTGEIFSYTSPLETPLKMAELMQWYKDSKELHPLVLASQLHYDFIRIHPFDDGNGRVARLLVNYVLMKNEYPPIIVKATDKDKYLTALNKADTGDLEAFHEYMADQLIWSLELAIKAAGGESIEEPDDLDKRVAVFNTMIGRKNEKIEKTKNEAVLTEMVTDLVEPLFKRILEKVIKIAPLFNDNMFTYYVNDENRTHTDIEKVVGDINSSRWMEWYDLGRVKLEVKLFKLKKLGDNSFDISNGIEIKFNRYDYQILCNSEFIERPYHLLLTKNEIEEMATRFANNIFDLIEIAYQNVKNNKHL